MNLNGWKSIFLNPPVEPPPKVYPTWSVDHGADRSEPRDLQAVKPYKGLDLYRYDAIRVDDGSLTYYRRTDYDRTTPCIRVGRDRVQLLNDNILDRNEALALAAAHFGDRPVRLNSDDAGLIRATAEASLHLDPRPEQRDSYRDAVAEIKETREKSAAYDAASRQREAIVQERKDENPLVKVPGIHAEYTSDGQSRYFAHGRNNWRELGTVSVEGCDGGFVVADGKSYAAAVALTKARFGSDVITTNSKDSAVMRAVLESGARIQHFESKEQKDVYDRAIVDLRRERNLEDPLPPVERVRDSERVRFDANNPRELDHAPVSEQPVLTGRGERAGAPNAVERPPAGYISSRATNGDIQYAHVDHPKRLAVLDTGTEIKVREPQHYAAAVAIAKERFGGTVQTNSMNPEFLRATIEGGLTVKHFASDEQKKIYEAVEADIAHSRPTLAPERERAPRAPVESKEQPTQRTPAVTSRGPVPAHPQHSQNKVPSQTPVDPVHDRAVTPTGSTGLKVAPKPKTPEPKAPNLDL